MVAVVVTTDKDKRGVFFGYIESEEQALKTLSSDKATLTLMNARNCIFWSAEVRGVFGLAFTGPDKDCRIGPSVPKLVISGVTAVAMATTEAARAWEAAPWKS